MANKYKIPRGTYDILPDDSYKWQVAKKNLQKSADLYNYKEIVTPIFEQSELFERSSGDSSDVVSKEMYRFEDRKGRKFALRPEGTAPVVRSFVNNNLGHNGLCKVFYSGPMFRYDKPQKGRYRQFYQYGFELFGSNHPYYDAEIIATARHFFDSFDLNDELISLEINSVGNPASSEKYDEALKEFFAPNLASMCPDCQVRFEKKPRRLLDCKVKTCKEFAVGAPIMLDFLDSEAFDHFEQVKFYLNEMNIKYKVNPNIVRGLDYYTYTAFEFLNNSLGAQNAVAGGGRYNGLVKQLGGKEVPAIGFAGGFERLFLSIEQAGKNINNIKVPEAYLITLGEKAEKLAAKIVTDFRAKKLNVVFDPEKNSMKAQMKAADKSKAEFAIIIGDDELLKNVYHLKNLLTGEQFDDSFDQAVTRLIKGCC